MKIFQICLSRTYGGVEKNFVETTNALATMGYEVFAVLENNSDYQKRFLSSVKLLILPYSTSRYNPFVWFFLGWMIVLYRPHVIHTHSVKASWIVYYLHKIFQFYHVATKHNVRKGKTILVQIARVTGWKDQESVIKAFLNLRQERDDLVLLIVGSVDTTREGYYHQLCALLENSPYKKDVIFTGNQSHIKEIFSLATLNLSASTKPETFGRANVEGMVMGVPLVTSAIGAAFDYVIEGKTGFFFPPGDVAKLQSQIAKALTTPFDPDGISTFAQENFSLRQMIEKTLKVYDEVVKGSKDS